MKQVAALPFRTVDDSSASIEVLLVTSGTGRWIIPKGNIDDGMAPYEAAEREAYEEGGVHGRIGRQAIGAFRTVKKQDGAEIPADVDVFPLEVRQVLDRWPEMGQRKRRWLTPASAADEVDEPGLRDLLRSFRPQPIGR